jgi:hypothetical protein
MLTSRAICFSKPLTRDDLGGGMAQSRFYSLPLELHRGATFSSNGTCRVHAEKTVYWYPPSSPQAGESLSPSLLRLTLVAASAQVLG